MVPAGPLSSATLRTDSPAPQTVCVRSTAPVGTSITASRHRDGPLPAALPSGGAWYAAAAYRPPSPARRSSPAWGSSATARATHWSPTRATWVIPLPSRPPEASDVPGAATARDESTSRPPPPATIRSGPAPAGNGAPRGRPVAPSSRVTVPSSPFATYTTGAPPAVPRPGGAQPARSSVAPASPRPIALAAAPTEPDRLVAVHTVGAGGLMGPSSAASLGRLFGRSCLALYGLVTARYSQARAGSTLPAWAPAHPQGAEAVMTPVPPTVLPPSQPGGAGPAAAAAGGPAAGGALRLWLLGGFRVEAGGRPVEGGAWRLRDARRLAKLLAATPGHRLHREQVLEALWPDATPERATGALHQALHAARRALRPDVSPRHGRHVLPPR